MKVLHVSTYASGGATKAGFRLHKGLLNNGVASAFLYLHGHADMTNEEHGYYQEAALGFFQRLYLRFQERAYFQKLTKHLKDRQGFFEMFSGVDTPYRIDKLAIAEQADVIVLHWVSNFIDHATFFKYINKPVVWVLHDMNPFSGGCHYAGNCEGYTSACSVCPQLKGTIDPQFSASILATKRKALNGFDKLHVVALSNWILGCSKQSSIFSNRPHYLIPNSIDHEVFKPQEQLHCREQLSLPANKKVILFVADNVHNHRKGYSILLSALTKMQQVDDVVLCQIGNADETDDVLDIPVIKLGMIKEEQKMAQVYAAADVFVIPSLEDNLPNTVLESLMCATPVIGFSSGGIKDMIEDEVNGYLVEEPNAIALARSIDRFLANTDAFDKEKIRTDTVAKYQLSVQANRFMTLLKELVSDDPVKVGQLS